MKTNYVRVFKTADWFWRVVHKFSDNMFDCFFKMDKNIYARLFRKVFINSNRKKPKKKTSESAEKITDNPAMKQNYPFNIKCFLEVLSAKN